MPRTVENKTGNEKYEHTPYLQCSTQKNLFLTFVHSITKTVRQRNTVTVAAETIIVIHKRRKSLPVTAQNCSIAAFEGFKLLILEAIPLSKQ
jgi:hypothetical protein